ncbi:hypothetical protein FACS1894159_10930 [Bacteroidia bacterium]|nr:hypothetical protein FACS1894159_10930 [Bacteroidia bacterium]
MKGKISISLMALLFLTSVASVSVAQSTQAERDAAKEKVHRERIAAMTLKYGLTVRQVKNYDRIHADYQAALLEIDKLGISPAQRHDKRNTLTRAFESKVQQVFEPPQFNAWLADRNSKKEVQKAAIAERRRKVAQIKNSTLSEEEKNEKIISVDKSINAKLESQLGPDAAGRFSEEQAAQRREAYNAKLNLDLSFEESRDLLRLEAERDRHIAALKSRKLKYDQFGLERKRILDNYETQVKATLGDKKYISLQRNRNGSFDRKLSGRYYMTPNQIRQYKDLMNSKAVDELKVRRSRLSQQEKVAKKETLKVQYAEKVREILSSAQYNKLMSDENYAEQKRNK